MTDILDGILGTVGLEIETELMPEQSDLYTFQNTHDASIEIPILHLRDRGLFVARTPANVALTQLITRSERRVMGREFVSGVYFDDEDIERALRNAFTILQRYGERSQNKRAGFHVHIGWAYDLATLKRTILISSWLESLMFHLGGMGYTFRGIENNSAYCRPITKFGPPVIESNLGTVQMTSIDALLSSNSIRSFWNRFGGTDWMNPPKRYTPQRYMGVNLFSIFLHKTLEFRMFNTTLNKDFAMAIIHFCREVTKFTQSSEKIPDEMNSVYDVDSKEVNHNLLTKLCSLVSIDPNTEATLREILEMSPVVTLNHVYVHTHVPERMIGFDERDIRPVSEFYKQVKKCEKAGILDIHILENEINAAQMNLGHNNIRRRPINPDLARLLNHDDEPEDPDDHDEEHNEDDNEDEFDDDQDGNPGINLDDPENDPGHDGNEPDLEIH
jgi:hypothetical protein